MNTRYFIMAGIIISALALLMFGFALIKLKRHNQLAYEGPVVTGHQSIALAAVLEIPKVKLEKINEKNLFHPRRGKPIEITQEQQKPGQGDPKFELNGIFGYEEKRGAIISGSNQKGSKVFMLGDSLGDGFILKEIKSDKAVLSKGERTITLNLKRDVKENATKQERPNPPPKGSEKKP